MDPFYNTNAIGLCNDLRNVCCRFNFTQNAINVCFALQRGFVVLSKQIIN